MATITILNVTIHNDYNEQCFKWITITMHNDCNEQWKMKNGKWKMSMITRTMNNDYNDNEQSQQYTTMYYNNYNETFLVTHCYCSL